MVNVSLTYGMGLIISSGMAIAAYSQLVHALPEMPATEHHSPDRNVLVSPSLSHPLPFPGPSPTTPMTQVPSVYQFTDVQETDWAFTAVRSLVERYGVIAGYPDGTFRGQRAINRYEFAAIILAVLEQVRDLMTQGNADQILDEDLIALRRLQEEFGTELDSLRDRSYEIEARIAELEATQFSTTTQLTGEAIFALNGGSQAGADDPRRVFLSRIRLNFATSFHGSDRLLAQFQAGNDNSDAAGFALREDDRFQADLVEAGLLAPGDRLSPDEQYGETVETIRGLRHFLQANSALDYAGSSREVQLNRLTYTFTPLPDLTISLFARGFASDYVDTNRYANNSSRDFSTYGLINNQLLLANDLPGAGAALQWNPGQGAITLRAVYRGEAAALPSETGVAEGGLFQAPNLGVLELDVAPSESLVVKLQYSSGLRNDGLMGAYDVIATNIALNVNQFIGVFGRLGYAYNFPGGLHPTSWALGATISDLVIPGTLAGIGVGQPLIVQDDDTIDFFDGVQTQYEVFYHLPFSDNLAITPLVQLITDPGNQDRGAILTGTLRVVIQF